MRDQGYQVITREQLGLPSHWAAYNPQDGTTRVFLENPRGGTSTEVMNEFQQRRVCDAVDEYNRADFEMAITVRGRAPPEQRTGGTATETTTQEAARSAPTATERRSDSGFVIPRPPDVQPGQIYTGPARAETQDVRYTDEGITYRIHFGEEGLMTLREQQTFQQELQIRRDTHDPDRMREFLEAQQRRGRVTIEG